MSVKETLRKLAAEKNGPVMMVPVLNDPTKSIALPCGYRDGVLEAYGTSLDKLLGSRPIKAIFMKEGLVLGFFCVQGGKEAYILHPLDLSDASDIEAAGSEVYEMWKSFPEDKLLSYIELQERAASLFGNPPLLN